MLLPLVTTDIGAFVATTGADSFTIRAAGETGGVPFIREGARPTATLLISMSREGALQGFARRIEPLPAALERPARHEDRQADQGSGSRS